MDTDRQARTEQILHSALQLDAEERSEFLRRACAEDGALLEAVRARLQPEPATQAQTCVPPSLIGQSLGSYTILSLLGKGGMGEVYLALDSVLERKVALKLLPAEYTGDANRIRRFEHEARTASALNHPNIVSIYGLGNCEHGRYIVMEWVDGRSLRALQPLPLPPASLCEIGKQAARALEATHAAGLIHRDIKPANIMIRHDGLVKVLDFGLARLAGPTAEAIATGVATLPGAIVGTTRYMSPEQARGEWLTAGSDIFSLGIVFYELATGQHPFQADSAIGYLQAIVSRPVIPPSRLAPQIPAWTEALLLRMLEKDPAKRCAATEVATALQRRDFAAPLLTGWTVPSRRTAVGRRKELAELQAGFDLVRDGRGAMLSISGEPGQGKTTLAEEFLRELVHRNRALVARGRCSERLAGAEAYLPVLETLDSLMTGVERDAVAWSMQSLAPAWYAQLARGPAQNAAAPSAEKLKRELAALLQEISCRQPLVIFLDDVHWADLSTIDLLSYLGARLEGLRVLILVSYREPELHSANQQLVTLLLDLQSRGICREVPLGFLSLEEIREYIDLTFSGHCFPGEFARGIHRRTEGNPLFVADLLRYLREREAVVVRDGRWTLNGPMDEMLTGLPESVRSMVQRKMEQLPDEEHKMLMAASIQGADFDAAVVARALGADPADIEEGLERIERKSGFVKLVAEYEYPNRSLTLRYRFVHVLYQDAFFAALRPTRRISLSKAVAEALVEFHGGQAAKIAGQLAFLYETAREFANAARQYQIASQNALHLFASSEAEHLARRGLDVVQSMPEDTDRARQELDLLMALAGAIRNLRSPTSGEVIAAYRRLLELAGQLKDYYTVFVVHYAIAWFSITHQRFAGALEEAEQCLRIAGQLRDPCMMDGAHLVYGEVMTHQGRLAEARARLELVSSERDPAKMALYARLLGSDPGPQAKAVLGAVLSYLGYPEQGRTRLREAIEQANRMGNPLTQGIVLVCAIVCFKHFGDIEELAQYSRDATAICLKHELQANMAYYAKFGQGWTLAMQGNASEGLLKMEEAFSEALASGHTEAMPIMAFGKAQVMRLAGRRDEAVRFIDEQLAAAQAYGQWVELPDLFRAKGELLTGEQAEECFVRAMECSRPMQARLPELEAATRLAELYRSQSRRREARDVLSSVYGWFTEGFALPVLERARAVLDDLSE